jgi:hypothetical protein
MFETTVRRKEISREDDEIDALYGFVRRQVDNLRTKTTMMMR